MQHAIGAPAEITSMAQTPDGWLWLGTPTGIYRFDGVRFEPYVPPPGSKLAHSRISELLVLPNGDLLIGYIWLGLSVRYADGRFEHLAQAGDQVRQVLTMTRDVDGSLWVATVTAVRRLAEGRWQTIGAESGVTGVARSVLADQHGQLYLSTDKGTLRLNRATRRFEPTDDKPNTMLVQSPDGRLWGGGDDNLHQVPTAAPRMPRPDWMNQAEGHAAGIFDRDGNLWALRCPIGLCVVRGADRLGDHLVPSRDATDRFDQPWQLGNLSTNLLLEDPLGNIWLSTQAGLERFRNSAMLPARVGGADGFYVLMRGIGGDVWVSDRRKHNVWLMAPGQPPKRHDEYQYVAAGRDWGLLLATSDYLDRRQGERVERLAWPTGSGKVSTHAIFDDGRYIWARINGASFVLVDGQWHKLTAAQPAVLTNVTGVTIGANGDRWINGMRGVLHVTQADWQRAIAQPAQPLRYDLFDATDGYIGEATTGVWDNTALTDGNGQLWFASTTGLYRLDPAKLWRHKSTPRAEILLLQAAQAHAPHSGLRLAPGTSQLRLDYTGLGSGKPEKLRFQYRLDGIDQDWQDADTRRSVYYTNLGPGDFRFHLRAVNEDGIWSKEESLSFSVEPTVVQSVWFKLALALLAAALLYLLYRQRLRINTRRALERFNLRVEERESIARDLHDTLLQSMQGVIYSVKAMAMDLPPQEPMRRAMDRTVKLATDALVEGRDRVSELRAEAATRLNLSDALQAIAAEHAGAAPQIAVRSEGAPRELHPVVHDELLLMGRECLLNAIRHAQASEVKVVLQWGERTLKLVVSDNGVGMPAEVAATQSKPGHWGLEGLHERAHRLQAVLGLETGAGGTEWTISVPAVLAYRRRASEAEA
ncbi:hypothetical protein HH213_29490 [Duganella dendranthematis]|uniref:Histidine kinase n=1 Tax=Duganella dendranthematis TaxID=2728021 RepID=A0ABX6MHQ0_9BURK|nr:sensor histidine kinase [Duganella dendranthematis]QJD93860.1 hypothetical protein HH213_29490 [Duganella dendranthematis]